MKAKKKTTGGCPRISDAEWDVMKVVWSQGPILARDIIEDLAGSHDWHPKTIKTLLNRLVKKGALGFKRDGRAYIYRALVSEPVCIRATSSAFQKRVFNGSLRALLASFVENNRISKDDAREIKRLVDARAR